MPLKGLSSQSRVKEPVIDSTAAPHATRWLAFVIDLLLIGSLYVMSNDSWVLLIAIFIGYHGLLLWLTGQTVGKAAVNLRLCRIDGAVYQRTLRGLVWTLGRASLGYFVFSLAGIGLLLAVSRRSPSNRALHDWVLYSQVVACVSRIGRSKTCGNEFRHSS